MSLNYQWAKLLMPRLGSIGERMMVNHSEHQMYPKVVHRHIATICDEIKARLYSEWETTLMIAVTSPGRSRKELALAFGVSSPTILNHLKKAEALGLIEWPDHAQPVVRVVEEAP